MRRHLRWLSYPLSAAVLGFVLWRLDLPDLGRKIAGMSWPLVALALLLGACSVAVQAFRWRYLLQPPRLRYRDVLQASYLGTLVNAVLPLRSGEVVRGVVVSHRTGRPLGTVASTEVVERLADGIAMTLLVSVAVRGFDVPPSLQAAKVVLAVGLTVAVGAMLALAFKDAWLRGLVGRWTPRRKITAGVQQLALDAVDGLRVVRNWKALAIVLGSAMVMLGLQVTMLWLCMRAYHLTLDPLQAAAVVAVISTGTVVPSTPSNLGTWQLSCVLGLTLMGVASSAAVGFSVVAFVLLSLGQITGGVVALATSPFSFGQLRRAPSGSPLFTPVPEPALKSEA